MMTILELLEWLRDVLFSSDDDDMGNPPPSPNTDSFADTQTNWGLACAA